MGLTEDTYKTLERAKKIIPDLEIRFIGEECKLYVNGNSRFISSGNDRHINASMDAILYGIVLAGEQKSLKRTLSQL